MVFKIESFNKDLDLFNVVSDTGEKKYVTSYQIVQVMLQNYEFVNAELTTKGFSIKTDRGTRYIQVNNMPKQVLEAIHFKLNQQKLYEEQKKKQMTQAIRQKPQVKTSSKIDGRSANKSITYKGQIYLSDTALCKKFNRDVNTFRELRSKGYSMDEALGLMKLRPESEIMPRKNVDKMLDSLSGQRGEF